MSEHAEPKTKTVKVPGPDHPITIERNAHRVVVKVGEKTFTRQVEAGTGSGCQNDLTLHFGLGATKGPAELTVFWASGGMSTQRTELNQTVVLRK